MRRALLLLVALALAGCAEEPGGSPTPTASLPSTPTPATSSPSPSTPTPVATASPSAPPAPAASVSIAIRGFAFSPADAAVTGGSVAWTNEDAAAHTVTADDGSFRSGSLARGASFRVELPANATEIRYHCEIHPSMTGVLRASGAGGAEPTTPPTTTSVPDAAAVVIDGFAFEPRAVTVAAGGAVSWTNYDGASHTVTADDGSVESGALAKDARFERTFATPGTFAYKCRFHPSMTGTVTVV